MEMERLTGCFARRFAPVRFPAHRSEGVQVRSPFRMLRDSPTPQLKMTGSLLAPVTRTRPEDGAPPGLILTLSGSDFSCH